MTAQAGDGRGEAGDGPGAAGHRPGAAGDRSGAARDGAGASGEPRVGGPSAFLLGPGHVIVHGNAAFVAAYGRSSVGQPVREALTDLPGAAFELLDRVLAEGRPLATRVVLRGGEERRVVAAPRRELGSDEVYGVVVHLRPLVP